ncbi:MAG TPA: 2-succinyl-6-hydroxy-2,4-cyclohexadiene-1-carboxylate synthase [Solirubrobacteraceae bacterium]|nr:2-succinyl-6-hydroxy-2,4-cyclohexadiene-1-carboxylate synthase [Solirubrobacteraceae bacterium]
MSEAPAVVLLHGFTNSGASWQPVISGLGQRYRAFAPDIRGHASAAQREPVTLDGVLADIAATPAARFALVGYSQGGRIALHAALALPHRVSALLLIGASPGLEDEAERAARREADERLAERIECLSIEDFASSWAQTPVLGGVSAEVAAAAHEDRLRSTPHGLAAALRGLGTGALPPLWDRLPQLRVPVRLLVGERDVKFTAIAAQMAQRIPDAGVAVVAGAGHAVHLEQPQAVVRELERLVPPQQPVTEA